eukprot:5899048-Pyramimonas_sp.AAC.1
MRGPCGPGPDAESSLPGGAIHAGNALHDRPDHGPDEGSPSREGVRHGRGQWPEGARQIIARDLRGAAARVQHSRLRERKIDTCGGEDAQNVDQLDSLSAF